MIANRRANAQRLISNLCLFLMISLTINNAFANNADKIDSKILFDSNEIHLIKSLASNQYDNSVDKSNKVSGNPAAIAFGKTLFFDPRLSSDGSMSCASCHNPSKGWSNHQAITSLRPKHPSSRHVPSLWGVKYNRWYFWDGRADSLWSQALKPIENPVEMANSRVQLARLIIDNKALRQAYEAIFGAIPKKLLKAQLPASARPISNNQQHPDNQAWIALNSTLQHAVNVLFANLGKAIAAFEETLVSSNSPFDKFARSLTANNLPTDISPSAMRGLKLFIGKGGCVNCHSGPNFSDGEFHHSFLQPTKLRGDLGRFNGIKTLLKDPFNARGVFSDNNKASHNKLDYVYQNVEFRGQFKTPSLRNLRQTAPYMHTGEFNTLRDVISYYNTISDRMKPAAHQEVLLKSLHLSTSEVNDLEAFLKSLSEAKPSPNNKKKGGLK